MLGQHSSRETLQNTTNINRVHDFLGGEGTHHESARVQLDQQPLLRKRRQGFSNRRS